VGRYINKVHVSTEKTLTGKRGSFFLAWTWLSGGALQDLPAVVPRPQTHLDASTGLKTQLVAASFSFPLHFLWRHCHLCLDAPGGVSSSGRRGRSMPVVSCHRINMISNNKIFVSSFQTVKYSNRTPWKASQRCCASFICLSVLPFSRSLHCLPPQWVSPCIRRLPLILWSIDAATNKRLKLRSFVLRAVQRLWYRATAW